MVVKLGKCTASCTVCQQEILDLGFLLLHSLSVVILCVRRFQSAGISCGKKIAHRGPNDKAWNAEFVALSEIAVGALSLSLGRQLR